MLTSLGQAEQDHAVGRANIDSSVRDDRREEFGGNELVAAVSGSVEVIEFGRKIRGIVSVQLSCAPVFNPRHNAVDRTTWRRSRIRERV